jgi:predicted DsbA family dithiol-disulfide isomerase
MEWLPFDLHPEYPPEGIPRSELHARYGEPFHEQLRGSFQSAGLVYNPPPEVVPSSRTALRLTELARDLGRHQEAHDRLMDAYWSEALDIGDPAVLRRLAGDVGVDAGAVERVLAGDDYADRVERSTEQALLLGANGIPAWLLDERLLVLGAQPREVFEQAFARLGVIV